MTAFQAVGVASPVTPRPDIGSAAIAEFRTPEGAGVATTNPVFKAALTCLAERAPESLSFHELCATARARLAEAEVETVAEPVADEHVPWYVADMLRRGALARFVELHILPGRYS